MVVKRRWFYRVMWGMVLSLVVLVSCQEKERWAGQYEATVVRNHEASIISLELKPDGTGSLADGEDNVSVKWEIRGKAIWLHTKTGGVIVGTTRGNLLELELPGLGGHLFTRLKQ